MDIKIEKLKQQMNEEVRELYFDTEDNFFEKHFKFIANKFKNAKEKALEEVLDESFISGDDSYEENLLKTIGNLSVKLEFKYRFIRVGSVVGPMMRMLLPILLSFGALLLTINSIEDINIKYLFGISLPTFITYCATIIVLGIAVGVFYTKLRNKRKFAIYIRERLKYETMKLKDVE